MVSKRIIIAACSLSIAVHYTANSFVVNSWSHKTRLSGFSIGATNTKGLTNSEQLFSSDGWGPIKEDLDQLPIFSVASKEGNPISYTIELGDQMFRVPFFYCDIADASRELKKAQEELEGVDLIPFPLGKAFHMWATDEAIIVPSKSAIVKAGAPPEANPIGQQIPLFTCLEIMQENEDGTGVLPLFMVFDEANAAISEAVGRDGGSAEDFEIVSLSLSRAVELLANSPEANAFHFIPPSASMKFIQDYLSA